MRWANRSIEDVCEIVSGSTPSRKNEEYWSGSDVPWFTVKDVRQQGHEIQWTKESVSKNALERSAISMVPSGTVLVCCTASIGEYALAQIPLTFNQQFNGLVPKGEVNPKYLMHWASTIRGKLLEMSGKATVDFVSQSKLKSLSIPLPPLEEQKRIAGILDEADRVRKKTQALIDKYDELAQSLFLDMFGDPVTNPKGWEVKALGNITDVRDGTHDSPKYVDEGFPLITSKNLRDGKIDFGSVGLISPEDFEHVNKRSKVDEGDILMPMIGTIGGPVIVMKERPFAIKNVALFKLGGMSDFVVFLHALLDSHFLNWYSSRQNQGGIQKFLSLNSLRGMMVPVPPVSLMCEFRTELVALNSQKQTAQIALASTKSLFEALLQKAFKGELS